MLVDNEHQCQLFYRSLPLPRFSHSPFPELSENGYVDTKGHGSFDPWPLRLPAPRAVSPPVASVVGLRRGCSRQGWQYQHNQAQERYSRRRANHDAEYTELCRPGQAPGWPPGGALRRRAEHERLHGDEMIEHRLPCRCAVATRDRLNDSPMVLM